MAPLGRGSRHNVVAAGSSRRAVLDADRPGISQVFKEGRIWHALLGSISIVTPAVLTSP
jgi:hypothetical protein